MSSAQNEYRIAPSVRYAALTTTVHVVGGVLVASCGVPAPLLLAVTAALAVSLWCDLVTVAWRRAPDAVTAIRERDGCWQLARADGTESGPARLETFRTAAPGVLLVLRDARGVCVRVVVPGDALPPRALRRLRARATAALGRVPGPAT